MMSEFGVLWNAVIRLSLVLLAGVLYAIGGLDINGQGHKWIRRYLASFVLVLGICVLSLISGNFSFYYLICYPLLSAAYSIGYGGAETKWGAILKRAICAIAITCAFLPIVITQNSFPVYLLFGLQLIISLATSIILGVFNPLLSAAKQFMIGLLTCCVAVFYV